MGEMNWSWDSLPENIQGALEKSLVDQGKAFQQTGLTVFLIGASRMRYPWPDSTLVCPVIFRKMVTLYNPEVLGAGASKKSKKNKRNKKNSKHDDDDDDHKEKNKEKPITFKEIVLTIQSLNKYWSLQQKDLSTDLKDAIVIGLTDRLAAPPEDRAVLAVLFHV
jgi:hypothetical protein